MTAVKFDLSEAFAVLGILPNRPDWRHESPWYFEDDLCYYRTNHLDGKIEVAVRETFDRWGNSTDFVIKIPATSKSLDRRIAKLRDYVRRGVWNRSWGDAILIR